MENMIGKYNIKDLAVLSGIKAHTLRIWEQRYGILEPQRTETNIRLYSNEDLKRILNVSTLNKHGIKISKIALLKESEINDAVKKISFEAKDSTDLIDSLIVAMVDLDEELFSRVVSLNTLKEGFELTVTNVIFPFLHKTGVMWQTGAINPAQEHFITNLIRQKLVSAIDTIKAPDTKTAKKIMFYLPEGELHEISLLLYAYMAKSRGYTSVYLGQSVPFNDLIKVNTITNAQSIVTVFTQPLKDILLKDYIEQLAKNFAKQNIFVSGYQIISSELKLPKNVIAFKTPSDFSQLL